MYTYCTVLYDDIVVRGANPTILILTYCSTDYILLKYNIHKICCVSIIFKLQSL